jgi:oligopeptide/dipeptide ABC transporter ATP-binding protein
VAESVTGERAMEARREREALVEMRGLTKLYPIETGWLRKTHSLLSAVENLDLTILRGETLGLVGESGSGKSTVARLVTRLTEPSRGEVLYEGRNIFALSRRELRRVRRGVQIVFQDPYSSLNPRHSAERIIAEGIGSRDGRAGRSRRVEELLELVGLSLDHRDRYPHEFSGGQRQRLAIARALAVDPQFLVLDEPVSALDVSVQSKILNLLQELKRELGLTYLFISHDLSIVQHMADRVAVLYLGHLMELAPKDRLFANPLHPYTQVLLSAVPRIGKGGDGDGRIRLTGEIPTAIDVPARCRFAPRCFRPVDRSWEEVPSVEEVERAHFVRCFNYAPLERVVER